MPRGKYERKKTVTESNEVFSGSEKVIDIAKVAREGAPDIEVASEDVLRNTEKMDRQRFMNELLEVHIHDPMGDQDSKFCFLGVNGDCLWLRRGETYQIPRKHVEILARAKAGRVVQTRHIAPDGSQTYIDKEVLNLQYPFSVVSDPSGSKGAVWLREILKQAA